MQAQITDQVIRRSKEKRKSASHVNQLKLMPSTHLATRLSSLRIWKLPNLCLTKSRIRKQEFKRSGCLPIKMTKLSDLSLGLSSTTIFKKSPSIPPKRPEKVHPVDLLFMMRYQRLVNTPKNLKTLWTRVLRKIRIKTRFLRGNKIIY